MSEGTIQAAHRRIAELESQLAAANAKIELAEKLMGEQAAMIEDQNSERGVLIGRIASLQQKNKHEIQRSNQLARKVRFERVDRLEAERDLEEARHEIDLLMAQGKALNEDKERFRRERDEW